MLYTLITSQLFVEKKSRFFGNFSETAQKLWDIWEIRLAVLFSLFFQILLISLGDCRRRISKIWVQIILWIAYLCADWVAAVALGILSHSTEQANGNQLPAFWAPFLLLHLGGPDTITAYSLEDNELWLRHLLGLVVQSTIASYVSFRSWQAGSPVSILSFMMFIPAAVKYGERTWVLSSANKRRLRNSMLRPPDPGPSYAKFMDEYISKEKEGFRVTVMERIEESTQKLATDESHHFNHTTGEKKEDSDDKNVVQNLVDAHRFYEMFKRLFAFLILSYEDWDESQSFFRKISYRKAFKLIDIELGFMFDVLYTKANVVYSMKGCILRLISLSLTIFVFVVFLIHVDKVWQPTTHVEVIITFLLLALAIILEIYGAINIIFSDWTLLWLRKQALLDVVPGKNLLLRCQGKRRRWSNSIAQYNLLSVWLKDRLAKSSRNPWKSLGIQEKLRKHWYTTYKEVPEVLKEFIFQELLKKSHQATDFKEAKRLCASRGGEVLKQKELNDLLGWSIDGVEFDQSILIWHIATDLCYHSDHTFHIQREIGKLLSEYMVYLLVVCPFMLPEGIGEIRSLDTEEEARDFFKDEKSNLDRIKACRLLLEVKTHIPPLEVKGPNSKSVLFDACRLANQLGSLKRNQKWEIIGLIWVEMLSYAAAQCKGPNHAQQLGQGGELLTHVWLLMAHLGITEQFQMPTGFAKKLISR